MNPDLSICVVNTDNRDLTLACIQSVYSETRASLLEVFVVDNASTDGSAEAVADRFPMVEIIRNASRMGFSTNNNVALQRATGRYLMLLNDDTVVQDGALDTLVSFMDANPQTGAAGGALLNPNGTRQHSWDYDPSPLYDALRPVSTWIRFADPMQSSPIEVGSVSGACMIVRREVVDDIGLLDTAFDPLYAEEADWCYRIRRAGWAIHYVPDARVIHLGSQTMNRAPLHKLSLLYGHKALLFRKHHGRAAVLAYKVGLFTMSTLKLGIWCAALPIRPNVAPSRIAAHGHVALRALLL